MEVFLSKDIKSLINNMAFRKVKLLNQLLKSISQNNFDQSISRSITIKDKKVREVRVGSLDVIYYVKGNKYFIISVNEASSFLREAWTIDICFCGVVILMSPLFSIQKIQILINYDLLIS